MAERKVFQRKSSLVPLNQDIPRNYGRRYSVVVPAIASGNEWVCRCGKNCLAEMRTTYMRVYNACRKHHGVLSALCLYEDFDTSPWQCSSTCSSNCYTQMVVPAVKELEEVCKASVQQRIEIYTNPMLRPKITYINNDICQLSDGTFLGIDELLEFGLEDYYQIVKEAQKNFKHSSKKWRWLCISKE